MYIFHMCLNLQQLRIWRLMIKYGPKIFGPNIAKLKRVIHFGCLIFKLHTLRACLFENGLWHTPQISLKWFIFLNSFKGLLFLGLLIPVSVRGSFSDTLLVTISLWFLFIWIVSAIIRLSSLTKLISTSVILWFWSVFVLIHF